MRVLIIEDTPLKLEEIKSHAISQSVNERLISTAKSIDSALENLENTRFDVVIIDMKLPQSDGEHEVDQEAGLSILECIKEADNDHSLKIPSSILVLTQYKDLINTYEQELKDCRVIPTFYEHGCEDWKIDITQEIKRTKALIEQREPIDFDSNIIVTIHGIRTHGDWQKKLEERVGDKYVVKPYGYNFHNGIDFFSEKSSQNEISLFIQYLERIEKEYPLAKIHIVSHSFGTYITYNALVNIRSRLNLGCLIFSGSVLQPEQDIESLYTKHNLEKVINDCSVVDFPLLAAQLISNRYSLAGIIGFKGDRNKIVNRYFPGGHSCYFSNSHLDDWNNILCNGVVSSGSKKHDGFCMDIYYGIVLKKKRFRLASSLLISFILFLSISLGYFFI